MQIELLPVKEISGNGFIVIFMLAVSLQAAVLETITVNELIPVEGELRTEVVAVVFQ